MFNKKVGNRIEGGGRLDSRDKKDKSNNILASPSVKIATILFIVASLAFASTAVVVVSTLANTQTASAVTYTKARCEVVKITNPAAGSNVEGVISMQGYATYDGGVRGCASLSGDKLEWIVDGVKIGTGKTISFDFGSRCILTKISITLKATLMDIPVYTGFENPHTISKTIEVSGTQSCALYGL